LPFSEYVPLHARFFQLPKLMWAIRRPAYQHPRTMKRLREPIEGDG